jgi:hypothetical protein
MPAGVAMSKPASICAARARRTSLPKRRASSRTSAKSRAAARSDSASSLRPASSSGASVGPAAVEEAGKSGGVSTARSVTTSAVSLRMTSRQHPGRSPRIRAITFPLRPPRLRDDPVDGDGLCLLEQAHPDRPPHTRFVFLGAGIRLGFPSHPASRRRSCLRLGVSTTTSSRDFHHQSIAHAGHTQAPRRAAPADPTDLPGSSVTQIGAARSRLPGARVFRFTLVGSMPPGGHRLAMAFASMARHRFATDRRLSGRQVRHEPVAPANPRSPPGG